MSEATPNFMAETRESTVSYTNDMHHFFYLDPDHTLEENVFFGASSLRMKHHYWDIFEFTEYEEHIIE